MAGDARFFPLFVRKPAHHPPNVQMTYCPGQKKRRRLTGPTIDADAVVESLCDDGMENGKRGKIHVLVMLGPRCADWPPGSPEHATIASGAGGRRDGRDPIGHRPPFVILTLADCGHHKSRSAMRQGTAGEMIRDRGLVYQMRYVCFTGMCVQLLAPSFSGNLRSRGTAPPSRPSSLYLTRPCDGT